MRRFHLIRYEDESGVSGTGTVAEGVRFSDHSVALRWVVGSHRSVSLWKSMRDMITVHGHGGKTVVAYQDDMFSGLEEYYES